MAFGLSIKIGADISGLRSGLGQASSELQKFGAAVGPPLAHMAKLAAAAAAAGVAIGSVLVKQSLASIDALGKAADRADSTTESMQALTLAGKLAGLSQEEVAKTADEMNKALGEAATRGMGTAYDALRRLNLTAEDLIKLPVDERLAVIADRMVELNYSSAATASTLKDFGIRGDEATNLVLAGGDAIRAARQEVEAYGIAISRVDARQVENANDAWERVLTVLRGIIDRVAVKLAPYLEALSNRFLAMARDTHGFQDAIDTAFRVAITGAGYVANAVYGIQLGFNVAVAAVQTFRFAAVEAFRLVLDGLVTVNDAVLKAYNFTIEQLNKIPGVNIGKLALLGESEFVQGVREMSDNARIDMEAAWDRVAEKWSQPLPSEGIKAFLAEVEAASKKAAETSLQPTAGAEEEGKPPADQKFLDELKKRLEALRKSNLDEIAAEEEKYAANLETLNQALENELLTQEEWHRRIEEEELQHNARLGDIDARGILERRRFQQQSFRQQARDVAGYLADITAGVSNQNRGLFEINKAAGIATAIVNAYEGISLTLAKYPYPLNIGLAAAHAAAAFAQVNAIRSTTFGGGGGAAPSLAGGTAATPVTPVTGGTPAASSTGSRVLVIEGLDRNQLFSGDAVRQLAEQLDEYYADGGRRVRFA